MLTKRLHKGPGTLPGPRLEAYTTKPGVFSVTPNTGRVAGGNSVTITGSHFRVLADGTLPTVMFGALPATSVVVVDQFTITCVVPAASSGSVDITITIGSESSVPLASAYTYYTTAIISLSPSYGPFGGGNTVTVFGYNFVTGSTIAFGANAATGVVFIDEQHFRCVVPAHAVGYVDVSITEPLGGPTATLRNAFQYTLLTRGDDIRRMPGIVIRDVLNNAPNTCSFSVDGNSNTPTIGEKIEIVDELDGDRLLFAGTAQRISQDYEDQTDQIVWRVTAVDFTWLFNRRRPVGRYVNMSVSDIVIDLVAKFAPGFTTVHVQTNLAKVTVFFDGSQDFVTCLSTLAAVIGGGHWYIDYNQDVHFFHIPPAEIPSFGPGSSYGALPASSFSITGTAITIAQGASNGLGALPAYVFFRHTDVYSDGTESMLRPCSNMLYFDGLHLIDFTIPIGAAIGALTVVKRRIYMVRLDRFGYPLDKLFKYAELTDNTTTNFSAFMPGAMGGFLNVTDWSSYDKGPVTAKGSFNSHPVGPATGPSAQANTVNLGWRSGAFEIKVACIYRDGSVSFPSPGSGVVSVPSIKGTSISSVDLTNVPLGATINGVDCIGRVIYYCMGIQNDPGININLYGPLPDGFQWPHPQAQPEWGVGDGSVVFILPDNTTTTARILGLSGGFINGELPQVGGGNKPFGGGAAGQGGGSPNTDPIPVWPNPDGPYLEDTDPPNDIDDDNDEVLRDPPFTSSIDASQVRNKVIVIGSGSSLTEPGLIGDTEISVADPYAFSPSGGTLRAGDEIVPYLGTQGVSGEGSVLLLSPLTKDVAIGEGVVNYYEANHTESQRLMGLVELDKDGNPTDGVHEYTIVDSSLKARFQLIMRANAELELFAMPVITVNYATRDPKTRSGQTVHVDLTEPPCVGDFLIQDVTIDQVHDESDQLSPRYTATACSVRYELNDLLLSILTGGVSSSGGSIANNAQVTSLTGVVSSAVNQGLNISSPAGAPTASPSVTGGAIQTYGVTIIFDFVRAHTLFSVPLVIREGIPGKIIVPYAFTLEQSFGASTYNTGFNLFLVHEGLAVGQALSNAVATSNAANRYIWNQGSMANVSDGVDFEPAGLDLTLKGSVDVTGGSGNFRVTVLYFIADALAGQPT